MFDEDAFQLKEPCLVRWLSYFHAVKVLVDHYRVIVVELEGAMREHGDNFAKGAFEKLCSYLSSVVLKGDNCTNLHLGSKRR